MLISTNLNNEKEKESNEIIVKQIVYGSVAFWLGKKADEKVSHKWAVYVRGLYNEDISYFVKEVIFTLHSSFTNNVRVVNKYPFELYESGWGEFDIKITINLIDELSKPIEFTHSLKLYPYLTHASMSTKKPVVSESYDEIIFVNPPSHIKEILLNSPRSKNDNSIQIPISNNEEEKKSPTYSFFSQVEESFNPMLVEKNTNIQNIKREPSFKSSTLDNKYDSMIMPSQMEIQPSQFGITPTFQDKIEGLHINSTLGNYKVTESLMGGFDNMNVNTDMNVEQVMNLQNQPGDSGSLISNNQLENDKKYEDKKQNLNPNYVPNLEHYFLPVDDNSHYRTLEDANKFVIQEISRLKKTLEELDKEINSAKKNIKEATSKIIY